MYVKTNKLFSLIYVCLLIKFMQPNTKYWTIILKANFFVINMDINICIYIYIFIYLFIENVVENLKCEWDLSYKQK